MSDKNEWIWMPHAGHFICGQDCRFRLNTCVGDYIVSTVGEYMPDESVRETMATSRGITLEGKGDARRADWIVKTGYEDLGCDRKYETMVFLAEDGKTKCCPRRMVSSEDIDLEGYNDPGDAMEGHLRLCEKWSSISLNLATSEVKP